MAKVGVIGAGSWGIALAKLLRTNGNEVTVWSIVEEEVAMLRREHEHIDKLPGVKLPEDVLFTTSNRWKGVPDSGGTVCIYKKHRKKYGRICDRRTDHCLRGKGN